MAGQARISDVARALGLSASRLRQLADRGVVPSERSPGGHRLFDLGAVRSALAALPDEEFAPSRWSAPRWTGKLRLEGLQEDVVWRDIVVDLLPSDVSQKARSAANYAFTVMLNNAIDHSGAATAVVSVWASQFELRFEIADQGRGALPHLQERLNLADIYDALGELTKGKTTTDPGRHSGEGIFFTSKLVDVFSLESAGLRWTVDNVRDDQAVGTSQVTRGTRIRCEIDPATTKSVAAIFGAYTDEDHQFTKTRTVVRLFGFGVRFISRSEAKRLMRGLDRFKTVVLDFSGVEEVGQGFVDEALRVWPSLHPETTVQATRMVGPVDFMVRRGLNR